MHKDLPKVFAVPITKKINNNEETFTTLDKYSDRLAKTDTVSITDINKIFNSKNHVYKSKLKITTKTETKDYEIVGMTKDSLITLNGDLIKINDILQIKKVS